MSTQVICIDPSHTREGCNSPTCTGPNSLFKSPLKFRLGDRVSFTQQQAFRVGVVTSFTQYVDGHNAYQIRCSYVRGDEYFWDMEADLDTPIEIKEQALCPYPITQPR